jgi:hypothetical protein
MTSKKLGALLQSVPPATARPAPDAGPAASATEPEVAPRRVAPAAAVKDESEVPLQVLIPARVREELGIMVAKERGASQLPRRCMQPLELGHRSRWRSDDQHVGR